MDIAGLTVLKNFEANEMSTKCVKLSTLCDSGIMPPSQFVDVSIALRIRIFETINKTWHADCRATVVSKILDWLVK